MSDQVEHRRVPLVKMYMLRTLNLLDKVDFVFILDSVMFYLCIVAELLNDMKSLFVNQSTDQIDENVHLIDHKEIHLVDNKFFNYRDQICILNIISIIVIKAEGYQKVYWVQWCFLVIDIVFYLADFIIFCTSNFNSKNINVFARK